MNLEKLAARISEGSKDGSGSFCSFYIIDGVGYKCFVDKHSCDHAYKYQKLASIFDMGPKCHSRFKIKISKYPYDFYGYITEIVSVLGDHPNRDNLGRCRNEFFAKFSEIGFTLNDSHDWNLGYKENRVVCIDFGSPGYEHLVYKRKRQHA